MRCLFRFAVVVASLLLSTRLVAQEEYLEVSIEPSQGSVYDTFFVRLINRTQKDYHHDACLAPRVVSLFDGNEPLCVVPPDPALCELANLAAGMSYVFEWRPIAMRCELYTPPPGLYEATFPGFDFAIPGRVWLVPDDAHRLAIDVQPSTTLHESGEELILRTTNTSGRSLYFDRCCYPPQIVDPSGKRAFCPVCNRCIAVGEWKPDETAERSWIAGQNTCNQDEESLPGLYRVFWNSFWDSEERNGEQFIAQTDIEVGPPLGRHLDLKVDRDVIEQGETITLTATNPLDVPVYFGACCDEVLFVDELGFANPCNPCPLDCVVVRSDEYLPGQSITRDVQTPRPGPAQCGLRPGRWLVLWGRNFGLEPGGEPTKPVWGMAWITVKSSQAEPEFLRADCDQSKEIDLTDAVFLLSSLFLGGGVPACEDACDTDDSGELDLSDAIAVLNYLFLGGQRPAEPFPNPGADPTTDKLPVCVPKG